jgi:hypothetical protein
MRRAAAVLAVLLAAAVPACRCLEISGVPSRRAGEAAAVLGRRTRTRARTRRPQQQTPPRGRAVPTPGLLAATRVADGSTGCSSWAVAHHKTCVHAHRLRAMQCNAMQCNAMQCRGPGVSSRHGVAHQEQAVPVVRRGHLLRLRRGSSALRGLPARPHHARSRVAWHRQLR